MRFTTFCGRGVARSRDGASGSRCVELATSPPKNSFARAHARGIGATKVNGVAPVQCDFDRAVGERPRTSLRSPDQHRRRRRRGNHTIIIGICRERPSSIVRPQSRNRALGGDLFMGGTIVAIDGASGSLCWRNAALGSASHARAGNARK